MIIIEPYVSVDSLLFGQSAREDCIALYGNPHKVRTTRLGKVEYNYDGFIIRFCPVTDTLCECTLLPYTDAKISSLVVTWDQDFLRKACEQDGQPVDSYGFIVMTNLGVAVTGIHDKDTSQLAVSVFAKGVFDDLSKEGVPFEFSNLNN